MKDTISTFQRYLKSKSLKWTPERRDVLKLILSISSRHFEADDILIKLRNRKNKIAKATIYRTLRHLVEAGVLRSVIFVDRHAHYEVCANHKHHSHLVCLKCGRIIEFFSSKIREELAKTARRYKIGDAEHKVEITGYCSKCQQKK